MENMPATSGGIPVQLRRLVLLGTPLVLGILEIWHPTSNESPFNLIVDNANWWFTLHILQLPLFGLMALAVYLFVDGLHGWAATISRIGAWFFVVFYIALDSVLVGSLLNGDIQIERIPSLDAIKQRSQLWWRGRFRPRSPVAPQHNPRVQPAAHLPQCYRP